MEKVRITFQVTDAATACRPRFAPFRVWETVPDDPGIAWSDLMDHAHALAHEKARRRLLERELYSIVENEDFDVAEVGA